MKKMTKKILVFLLLLVSFFFSGKVLATTLNTATDMEMITQDRTIDGPAFLSGNLVRVDGTVNGTTFVAGENIHINGMINGDLFVAAQNAFITGEVTGNIYFVGMAIMMEGIVGQDTFLAGQTMTVSEDAILERDLFSVGATIIKEGDVGRHMYGAGERIVLSGSIGGKADFNVDQLTLGSNSVIKGNLIYRSEQEADIETGADVQGETDFRLIQRRQQRMDNDGMRRNISARIWSFVWSVLSAVLIWFVMKWLRPTWWERTASPLLERPGIAIGVGLLALVVTPLAAIIIMITIIGIPLGILVLLGYGILLYLAKILVSVAISLAITSRTNEIGKSRTGWLVVLSLIILGLLGMIPYLGFILWLLVAVSGLGTFVMSHFRKNVPVN